MLSFMRLDLCDRLGESAMAHWIDRLCYPSGPRRRSAQIVGILPACGRPNGAVAETSAAIGTDILQHIGDAGGAKRALETAYPRVG